MFKHIQTSIVNFWCLYHQKQYSTVLDLFIYGLSQFSYSNICLVSPRFFVVLTQSCTYSFFFQAEDGIRFHCVTGVQTCALPIFVESTGPLAVRAHRQRNRLFDRLTLGRHPGQKRHGIKIGRASCRERV